MEIQYTVEPENNLIRLKVRGEVTTDEFIRNARTLYNDPRFEKGMNTLVDVTGAEFTPSFREVMMTKDFVKAVEGARGFCKWAIYDAGLSDARDYYNLYKMIANDVNIEARAFEDTAEAEKWVMESNLG